MAWNEKDFERIIHATVYDRDGARVGNVGLLYLDGTGQPAWVTVNTGLFGTSESFVPMEGAALLGDGGLQVPWEKSFIKDAPRVRADGPLRPEEEEQLYLYYRLNYRTEDVPARGDAGDTASMTAAEERLRVGKEHVETGRVRLRKYVTTEQETVTVPVEKERLRVEREPVAGDTRRDRIGGDEVDEDIVLREERPVVSKEVHETERVTIGKETVTEQERVAGEVRKEHVEVDRDDPREGGKP